MVVKPPPISRSLPPPPDSMSAPPEPPVSMLSWLLPVIVSLPLVPPIFSMLRSVSVSPSWLTMTSVAVSFRVTLTPVGVGEDHRVAAGAAVEDVVGDVADEDVVAGAARGVLDQRAAVVVVEQRHGDVAGRQRGQVLVGQVVGQLGLVEGGELARAQVDGDAVRRSCWRRSCRCRRRPRW